MDTPGTPEQAATSILTAGSDKSLQTMGEYPFTNDRIQGSLELSAGKPVDLVPENQQGFFRLFGIVSTKP